MEALRGPKPAEHVWHVSVRNAPGDRILSDAEWAEVAAAMVHAAGIAEHGDEQACRWIAVRHEPDHIHLLATLARQDGRHPRLRGDIPAMHAAARVFEARWGFTPMSPLDRTTRRRPVTGEAEKARQERAPNEPPAALTRHGRDENPEERADRMWNDLLQELRVAQTGVQILYGCPAHRRFPARLRRPR